MILNTSNAIHTESVDGLNLDNIMTRNAGYYDLYAISTSNIEKYNVDLGPQTYISDTRLPDPIVEADSMQMDKRPQLVRNIPKPDDLRKLNLSWLISSLAITSSPRSSSSFVMYNTLQSRFRRWSAAQAAQPLFPAMATVVPLYLSPAHWAQVWIPRRR